jgi:hypothetical protein
VGAPLLPIHSTSTAPWQLATDSLSAALKTCLRIWAESSVALRRCPSNLRDLQIQHLMPSSTHIWHFCNCRHAVHAGPQGAGKEGREAGGGCSC